ARLLRAQVVMGEHMNVLDVALKALAESDAQIKENLNALILTVDEIIRGRKREQAAIISTLELEQQLEKMRRDWDERARENARYYVSTGKQDWTDDEFFRSGEQTVSEEILTDMINICQGSDPKRMR